MQTQTRRLLTIATVALTVGAVFLAGSIGPVSAQAGNDSTAATVTVSANGDASGEPNTAVVRIESAATGDSPSEASDRLANNTTRLREALTEAGVSSEQLRTISYSLDEVRSDAEIPRSPRGEDDARPVIYRARQGFEITLDDTSRAGELVDRAVANGATSVLGVEFRLSDDSRSQLRQQALEDAMGNARSQAETLAATESLEITGVRSISTDEPFFGPVRAFDSVDGGAGTTIDGGPITVGVTVRVTYEAESP